MIVFRLRFVCVTLACCTIPGLAVPELKLLHVLFAHKLYAPWDDYGGNASLPQTLSYEYFTSTTMDMSNNAKLNMYNLGAHLRETYDEFLGDTYTYDITSMRTTEYALSMLSAQLVNAGLWPPSGKQIWMDGIDWQPIPTDYMELKEDTLMLGSLCPNFISQMDQVSRANETRKMISRQQPLFDYLSHYTERRIETPSDVTLLYASLETTVDRDEILPHWARDVFPDGAMYNVTLLGYDLLSATPLQRQLNGGTLLGETISNSLKYTMGDIPEGRRIMLYSGDERNIVGVLKNLDLWSPHIPNEAASLIFELYFDNDTDTHGVKIIYYTGIDETMITLLLPNCTEICPLQYLLDITFDLIPQDAESLCGWSIVNSTESVDSLNHSGSVSYNSKNLIVNLILLYLTAWYLK